MMSELIADTCVSSKSITKEFEYEVLENDSSAFRLLIVSPGAGDSIISCTLFEDSREDHIFPYEALSYTWGDATTIKHIILNNGTFPITNNLYIALRHLRYPDKERILWVDAICINQSSPLEKTNQVSQMRDIYQAAERVVVWLGEGNENTSRVVSWVASHTKEGRRDLKHLTQTARVIMDGYPQIDHADEIIPGTEEQPFDRRIQLLQGFHDLLSGPWWTRVWVIQEVVVNANVNILCGGVDMKWSTFMTFVEGISRSRPLLEASLEQVAMYRRAMERTFAQKQFASKSPRRMFDLLMQHRGLASTDPRDNVYALLGLASDMSKTKFLPDYSKPTVEVYKKLTRELVKRQKSLSIICASQPPVISTSNLPTWTPDWSSPWSHYCFARTSYSFLDSFSRPPEVTFSKNLACLNAQGYVLATVSSSSPIYEPAGPTLSLWLSTVKDWRTLIASSRPKTMSPFSVHDFQKIYLQHVGEELPLRFLKSYPELLFKKNRSKKDVLKFRTWMNTICWNRRLAQTTMQGSSRTRQRNETTIESEFVYEIRYSEGPEALVPANTVEGDKICVLFGCQVPVVLRQNENKRSWTFVGDAYIKASVDRRTGMVNGSLHDLRDEMFSIR